MNRQVKVKLWDRKNKQMLKEGMTFYQDPSGLKLQAFSFEGQPESEDEVLLEYTGIVDVRGVEICEGDLVRNSAGVIWWIVWDETKARWAYRRGGIAEQPFGRTGFGLTYTSGSKVEVVGNLFENPDLLSNH